MRAVPYRDDAMSACRTLLIAALIACAAPTAFAQDADADRALDAKLDPYVDCLNVHSNWVLASRDRYLSWIADVEAGPTGDEEVAHGPYRLRDPADCLAGIATAAELPPDLPELEADAAQWAQALEQVRALTAQADDYYESGGQRDDAMRQGKNLHPRLMAAWSAFDAVNGRLHTQITGSKAQLAAGELERLRADPARQDEYHLRLALFRARELAEFTLGAGDAAPDPDAYAARLEAFATAYRDAAADLDRQQAAGGDTIATRVVIDRAREYLEAAQGRADLDHQLDTYNRFVEAANRHLE